MHNLYVCVVYTMSRERNREPLVKVATHNNGFDNTLAWTFVELLGATNLEVEMTLTLERNRVFKQKLIAAIVLSKLLVEFSCLPKTISLQNMDSSKYSSIQCKVEDQGAEFLRLQRYLQYLDISLDLQQKRSCQSQPVSNQNETCSKATHADGPDLTQMSTQVPWTNSELLNEVILSF